MSWCSINAYDGWRSVQCGIDGRIIRQAGLKLGEVQPHVQKKASSE